MDIFNMDMFNMNLESRIWQQFKAVQMSSHLYIGILRYKLQTLFQAAKTENKIKLNERK